MSLTLRHVLVFGLCLSIGACAFKKEDAEDQQRQNLVEDVSNKMQEDQKNAGVDLKESNVSISFEPGEPGYYTIHISWPDSVGRMEVFFNDSLRKSVTGRNSYDQTVRNGDKITVSLRAYASVANGGRLISEFESDVAAPLDILINKINELSKPEILSAERIFFGESGQIVTNGFGLSINVKQLTVLDQSTTASMRNEDSAKIVTYKSGDSKSTALNSNIEINADKAEGKLSVALIGINGKDGRDAKDFAPTTFPPTAAGGSNGADALVAYKRGMCLGPDNTGCDDQQWCDRHPTNGENGKDGQSGTNGEDGQKGGSTGNISIQIANSENFAVSIFQRPGLGGKGGAGTPGQKGGPGGHAGRNADTCTPARNGQPGKDGIDGKNGKDGSCGEWGEIISNVKLTIPEKEINSLCTPANN